MNESLAAVITGAASGLGRATAIALAERGHPVAAWDIDQVAAEDTAQSCRDLGVRALAARCDVSDRSRVFELAKAARAELGTVGKLAACAGTLRMGGVGEMADDAWARSMAVNVNGALNVLESLIPSLVDVGRGAAVVLVSSTEGVRGVPFHAGYTASKHAVVGLGRSAAQTLGPSGVRVNVVCPGTMNTPMFRQAMAEAPEGTEAAIAADVSLGYVSDPAEVANVIRFLLSDEASFVHGATIVVDGGLLTA